MHFQAQKSCLQAQKHVAALYGGWSARHRWAVSAVNTGAGCLPLWACARLEGDGDEDSTSPYSAHPHSFFSAGDGATPGPEVMPDGSLRYASMPPILKAGQVAQVSVWFHPNSTPLLLPPSPLPSLLLLLHRELQADLKGY